LAIDERLIELLMRAEELEQQGRAITAEELCHDCPEQWPKLQRLLGGSFTSGPSDGYDSPAAFGSSYEGSGGMLMGG